MNWDSSGALLSDSAHYAPVYKQAFEERGRIRYHMWISPDAILGIWLLSQDLPPISGRIDWLSPWTFYGGSLPSGSRYDGIF